ncbi:hypothetical protein MSBRW_3369 [Methanosarcina barkeri str. Wiesmoor]|uniref:CRISPR type III-B/RAMP module-associated protein Cmr5 n=2 Tax=Methanosarcina barkeri TaxID=2208 RepID=A0A0E3QQ04_METBA|nr:hypothetical protein [Methanosarcina barkeri]AKB52622.1 hypothetical protein MSBRW_3369 [Methanosarcina barkeri str. Wiesmoor]
MNLDLEAARTSQEIMKNTMGKQSKSVENLVTKTLGVLQENGIYACMLFLCSRSNTEKEIAKIIRSELLKMTDFVEKISLNSDNSKEIPDKEILEFLTNNICNDIDMLFFTKQLWEQTLIYTRYGAKARED